MVKIRWSPKLFAALGAGFKDDATVRDGIHLRWTLDPRLGLPVAPKNKGFSIAFSRTKEGSIVRVDLFKASRPYPVRSNTTVLPPGPGLVHRDGDRLSFLRNLLSDDWLPYWRYQNNRTYLDALMLGQEDGERAFLDYMDGVMGELDPIGPTPFTTQEDVVAVDVRFKAPDNPPGGGLQPFDPIEPDPLLPISRVSRVPESAPAPSTVPTMRLEPIETLRIDRFRRSRSLEVFNRFRPQVFATVQGFDHCDRLVAEDWVGRHAQVVLGPRDGPFPPHPGALKLTARLRAAGIRHIRIQRRPGFVSLAEDEIRWVFCDEYASARGLWATIDSEVLSGDANTYTASHFQGDLYAPFRASAEPRPWGEMAQALRSQFVGGQEIAGLLSANDTFELATTNIDLVDSTAPTDTSDDAVALPLLAALLSVTIDPAVARLFGLYGFLPTDDIYRARDWRVLADAPFAGPENLKRLDERARQILDRGGPFFHVPGDSLSDLTLAGLVLNADETKKPAPPQPETDLDADVQLVPADGNQFRHLIRATLTVAPEGNETRPWHTNACYEVVRMLSGEPAVNVIEDDDAGGPIDRISLLPNVMVPTFDDETCLSTGELTDVISRDATIEYTLSYVMQGYDLFGRPSEPAGSDEIVVPAACLPPPAPGSVSAQVRRSGEDLALVVDFDLGQTAAVVEATWQVLEALLHTVPTTGNTPPAATSWSGAWPGRLLELGFDPATLALRPAPVQQRCMSLTWAAGSLQRTATTENNCSTTFPGEASVVPLEVAQLEAGREAFRITVPLGERSLYAPGLNAWCARLRVSGLCEGSGQIVHSPEVVVRAQLFIPAPPPPVIQPPVEALPLSTYPDALGKSYFSLNLRALLNPGQQNGDTLVKVYLARLEALTDDAGDFVDGETVTDPPGLIALARQSKQRFAVVSDPSEQFDANNPHVAIEVPGDVSRVYVAAVVGTDSVLETGPWSTAAFVPFGTPPPRPLPIVEWLGTAVETGGGQPVARLDVGVRFPEPMPDPARPPTLQLFRRDLSTGQTQARFVTVAQGETDDATAETPRYTFALQDSQLEDWHRYEYAAQLVAYAPWRDQYVKIGSRVTQTLVAPMVDSDDPFADPQALDVSAAGSGGFEVAARFAAGDFTVELEKELDAGAVTVQRARIEGGRLFLPEGLSGTLSVDASCELRIVDPDPATGLYRLRLRFGQALSIGREARTP